MTEEKEEHLDEVWKKFLRKHWKMVLIAVGGIAAAAIAGIMVFLVLKDWFVATSLVPATIGLWTIGYGVTFFFNILLWEFIYVGIPVIIAAVLFFVLWWTKLPEDEKEEYKREPKKKRSRGTKAGGGSGGASFFIFIVWLIIVFVNNMWNTEFNLWTLDYLITSSLWAFGIVCLIGGIPLTIVLFWWLRRELKEPS